MVEFKYKYFYVSHTGVDIRKRSRVFVRNGCKILLHGTIRITHELFYHLDLLP